LSGSAGALLRRRPLRTVRATHRGTRLKQPLWRRGICGGRQLPWVTRRTLTSVLARLRSINFCRLRTLARSPSCAAVKIPLPVGVVPVPPAPTSRCRSSRGWSASWPVRRRWGPAVRSPGRRL